MLQNLYFLNANGRQEIMGLTVAGIPRNYLFLISSCKQSFLDDWLTVHL